MREQSTLSLALAVLLVGLVVRPGLAQESKGDPKDKEAIAKRAEAFVEAFHKADAKAVAAFWTPDGDYTSQTGRQTPALEPAVHRTRVPADAGGAEILPRQRLQDLHRDRRRPGFRACLRRAGVRDSAGAGGRQRGRDEYSYAKDGRPILTKEPKLLLNDNDAGKPEGIHLMIGRRPYAAFGNSTGDQPMLEYTTAGDGARLGMLLLQDDAKREYAYGPAQGLPDTKVGTFTPALYDEATKGGWIVIRMKSDWRRLFPFDPEVVPAP